MILNTDGKPAEHNSAAEVVQRDLLLGLPLSQFRIFIMWKKTGLNVHSRGWLMSLPSVRACCAVAMPLR
jgi:hypothetical protein